MTYDQAKAELRTWVAGGKAGSNFHSLLYFLIAKSDPENREQLRLGFPEELQVFEDWHRAESEERFFES